MDVILHGVNDSRGDVRINTIKLLLLQQYVVLRDHPVILLSVPKDGLNLVDLASRFCQFRTQGIKPKYHLTKSKSIKIVLIKATDVPVRWSWN